jgi:glycosyltransferase involved in cell wall biosynthesis
MSHKILVVSHTAFRRVGRVVYIELLNKGYDIIIIHPKTLKAANGSIMQHEPKSNDEPPLIALEQTTRNPRIQTYRGLIKTVNEINPQIILLENDPISYLALQLGFWAKKNKAKLICLTNDNVSRTLSNSFKRNGVKGLLYSLVLQLINFISRPLVHNLFVISNAGLHEFMELGYKSKVSKIPLGFDHKLFFLDDKKRIEKRKELGLEHETVIAYFGRMKYQKGIHILIEALALLKERSWKFMMDYFEEGGDDYRNFLKQLIQKHELENRLIFVHPKHLEVADYMRAADIIVVPSLETGYFIEQYGRVVPEAMACGALTIVSNTGALPELLNKNGWEFKQGDIQSLYQMLLKVIDLDGVEKQKIRTNASKYALENLSINKQAEVMMPFLN